MSARYCGQNTILRRYFKEAHRQNAPARAGRVLGAIQQHRATCIVCGAR